MSLLLALFLVVHASIHIGYICGPAWPFVGSDPWLVTVVGAGPDAVRTVGIALALVSFFAYVLAALTAIRPLRAAWKPSIVVASVSSAMVLVLFVTPWTLPGLLIDAVLLWAALARSWQPTPFFGCSPRASSGVQEAAR